MSSEERNAEAMAVVAAGKAETLLAFADALVAQGQRGQTQAPAEVRQYVAFFLGETEYAIPILQCREIVRLTTVTRVPEAPAPVRGVVSLRGHIMPAVDTRLCLGLPGAPPTPRSRLLVVEVTGRLFGFIVDRVARIIKLSVPAIESSAEGTAPLGVTGAVRVGDGTVLLMDADLLLHARLGAVAPNTRGEEA
ncbi:MAG: purine-binding chemotaxis protein CheW [Deltaproteobacteria bacterium]|nr:purine-binding chemotaxis protein CheW [Deltaproteobacteria bacterium]